MTRPPARFKPRRVSFVIRHSLYLFLFLFTLALYALTLAPGLLPADAGEFQFTALTLGIAHPPGFALYTLLSWLTTRWLFFLSPAAAVNALSALLAALTVTLTARIVQRATGSLPAALGAALALAGTTTFWAQATTANVRMLAAFAMAWALDWILTYRGSLAARNRADAPSTGTARLWAGAANPLAWTAFALGLGVSHHPSTLFIATLLSLYALWLNPPRLRRPWPLLAGLAPFLAWLYFPLRGPAVGLPRLATLAGFLEHVLARGFAGDILAFATWADLPGRFLIFGNILTFELTWPLLILAALGAIAALYRDRPLGLTLLSAWAVHSFIALTYRAPQTVEYLLPAYVLMAVLIGFGLAALPDILTGAVKLVARYSSFFIRHSSFLSRHFPFAVSHSPFAIRHLPLVVTTLAAFAAVLPQFLATYPSYRVLARDDSTHAYAAAALAASDPNALLLSSWHWYNPLRYVQAREAVRPDVEARYVYPHGASLAQNWADEIQASAGLRPVTVTSFYEQEFNALPYRFLPFGPAWGVRTQPFTLAPGDFEPGPSFGEWTLLRADLQSPAALPADAPIYLTTLWQTTGPSRDINFYAHLVGADGLLYGQMDVSHPAARYLSGEALLDRYRLDLRPDTPPGEYVLVAGVYTPEGTRLAEAPLTTVTITPRREPPVTLHPVWKSFGTARLIGYDLDHSLPEATRLYLHWRLGSEPAAIPELQFTLPIGPGYLTTTLDLAPDQPLPFALRPPASNFQFPTSYLQLPTSNFQLLTSSLQSRYVPLGNSVILTGVEFSPAAARPGGALNVTLHFLAARPITQDISVGLALAGSGWRAQSDGTPVGGAIPTLKWIAGSRLTDRRTLPLPAEAAPGPAQLTLVLYDAFTQQKLALLDPRLALLGSRVPLGTVQTDPP